MENQNIIHLLDNPQNQICKFRTKNWVEVNDNARRRYTTNSETRIKTLMLKSSLWNYSDAYTYIKETITVPNTAAANGNGNNANKKVILKNCTPFTESISEINNTQIDKAKDLDVVKPMYNLIEYSDNYSKTSRILW